MTLISEFKNYLPLYRKSLNLFEKVKFMTSGSTKTLKTKISLKSLETFKDKIS